MKKNVIFDDAAALHTASAPVIKPSWSKTNPSAEENKPVSPANSSATQSRAKPDTPDEKIIEAAEEAYKQGFQDARKDLKEELKEEIEEEIKEDVEEQLQKNVTHRSNQAQDQPKHQEHKSAAEKLSVENRGKNDQELPHKDSKIVHLETDPALKKMEREGEKAGVKEEAKLATQTQHKLESVMNRREKILLKCKTLFPFDLFPSTLLIDTLKISIVRKSFFATEHVTTIPLKDLADVFVQTALVIASLSIEYRPQSTNMSFELRSSKITIYNLRRADALKAKDILKGVLIAREEDIDTTKLNVDKAAESIEKLGNSSKSI
jgi:hypothetical protein